MISLVSFLVLFLGAGVLGVVNFNAKKKKNKLRLHFSVSRRSGTTRLLNGTAEEKFYCILREI